MSDSSSSDEEGYDSCDSCEGEKEIIKTNIKRVVKKKNSEEIMEMSIENYSMNRVFDKEHSKSIKVGIESNGYIQGAIYFGLL